MNNKPFTVNGTISQAGLKFLGKTLFAAVSLLTINCSPIKAQSASDTAIRVYQSDDVTTLVQKRADYAKYTKGTFPGYRVQVNFGQNRSDANKVMSDFEAKYPHIPAYMSYQQPYFKVNVGDFRTKMEAYKNLNMLRRDYPGAFVVNDKINPPVIAAPASDSSAIKK